MDKKQTKLFSDKEGVTNKRPENLPEKLKQKFFLNEAKYIKEQGWCDLHEDDIVEELENVDLDQIGFEIAKDLDDSSGWSFIFSVDFIEYLEHLGMEYSREFDKYVSKWVELIDLKPKFERKTKLEVKEDIRCLYKKNDVIYVTGMKEETGNYLISKDKKRNGGYVLPFEEIEDKCEKML